MSGLAKAEIIRRCFAAYETNDRALIDGLLSEDFHFTSPYDDRIDRAAYFERCWANSDKIRHVTIEKVFEQGDEAFVRYKAEVTSGAVFRNTELFRFDGDKVCDVDVYFGRTLRAASDDDAATGDL